MSQTNPANTNQSKSPNPALQHQSKPAPKNQTSHIQLKPKSHEFRKTQNQTNAAATPPTYPFPAYKIVKEQNAKNKTTGQSFPSRNAAD
jgi:hypothetical protein